MASKTERSYKIQTKDGRVLILTKKQLLEISSPSKEAVAKKGGGGAIVLNKGDGPIYVAYDDMYRLISVNVICDNTTIAVTEHDARRMILESFSLGAIASGRIEGEYIPEDLIVPRPLHEIPLSMIYDRRI